MRRKSERATPKKAETTVTPRRTRRGRGAARSPSPEEETPEENQVTTETQEQSHEEVQQHQQTDDSEDEVIPLPKKRGRRGTRQSSTEVETTPTTKRRGRQRRVTQVSEVIEEETPIVETIPEEQSEETTEKEVEVVEPEVVQEGVEQKMVKGNEREEIEEVQEQPEVVEEQAIAVDDESNDVSEVPSEPAQETPEQPPVQEEPVHNLVAEDSSKDSDIVDIQPAQDDFEQALEPSVPEDEDMSRESGEIVEEKTVEPELVPETPKRPRRKFMSRFSIQATRDEQKPESINESLHESAAANNLAEVTKEDAPKDLSEKQHQPNDNDVSERVSNKKRSSRSKENDHNNLDVVTNTNNKNKSSIKSGGAEYKNDVDKELDENSEEKENEPSATAAISAAPLPAGQRKRKWITQKSVDNKPAIISISTDSLKELIPEVVPVPINDVQMDVSPEAGEIIDDANTDKENEQVVRKRRVSEKSVENSEKVNKKRKPEVDSHEKTHGSTKDTLNHKDKVPLPPSPPKQTQSNILYITNLVRPFTVLQLKGLLARTGKIVENGFWIDKIKSKCFVQYETEDEAVETRHALHGVRWPTSNPKCLNVDFGRDKDMEKAIVSTLEDNSRSLGTTDAAPKESSGGFGWSKADAFRVEIENQKSSWDKDRPVREWDLGKKDELLNENEERHGRDERRRDRGERKRSQEPGDRRRSRSTSAGRRKERKTENDPPIRLLDDLFRKTKATPCIYWLPLTSEQIAEREEVRRKRLEEQERQLKEMQKAREERMKERERLRQERQKSRSRENKDRVEKRRRSRSRSRSRSRDRRRYNR